MKRICKICLQKTNRKRSQLTIELKPFRPYRSKKKAFCKERPPDSRLARSYLRKKSVEIAFLLTSRYVKTDRKIMQSIRIVIESAMRMRKRNKFNQFR